MKRNFIITTGLIDTWEFYENNFVLGKWCEFYETNDYYEEKFRKKIPEKINIIKNKSHWNDKEKLNKDYEYLKVKLEYLLEIISEKLSTIHNINEDKEYWRVVIYKWLQEYVVTIFDRWEEVRIFFEKNKNTKFYSNFISIKNLEYLARNHKHFHEITQNHEWNHLIFLRLFHFSNFQNLSLIEKKTTKNNLEGKKFSNTEDSNFTTRIFRNIDNIISKFAFKFNKIILESFFFPKKEYLKICLRCKLIPSKYKNFFNFDIKENSLSKNNKRFEFKNLILKINNQDKFIQFLLSTLHRDIPMSYLENFDEIKRYFLPFAQKKKIIFSMFSLFRNDNFKIYLAETKKIGSKYIHTTHGGSLTVQRNHDFGFLEKVSDKIIIWDSNNNTQKNIFINLSPTLPIIKLKNPKIGNNCSIVFVEQLKYLNKFPAVETLDQSIEFFNELIHFVNNLNPEIKSKVKYRATERNAYNSVKKFSEIFGEKSIEKISFNNPFKKTILNSRLIIVTYPQTTFSEAMYSNIPTILIIKKSHHQFIGVSLRIFNILKKNKIAFEDFNEAKTHINKHWRELDLWWRSKSVQFARKEFLINFFNVKSDWDREWSDYIYFSKKLLI